MSVWSWYKNNQLETTMIKSIIIERDWSRYNNISMKVALEKAVEEYKTSEAFKDKVIEGALDMFLSGFDEC